MIDQINCLLFVVYANNLHSEIDAQRNALRYKLLCQLRLTLQSLHIHCLPWYPCFLLAHLMPVVTQPLILSLSDKTFPVLLDFTKLTAIASSIAPPWLTL